MYDFNDRKGHFYFNSFKDFCFNIPTIKLAIFGFSKQRSALEINLFDFYSLPKGEGYFFGNDWGISICGIEHTYLFEITDQYCSFLWRFGKWWDD